MDEAELRRALEEIFDQALVYHGFTDYMRDYEMVIHMTAAPSTGIPPSFLKYLFKHCVESRATTTLSAATWKVSLDDRLIDFEGGRDLEGYVWGVKYENLYPGPTIISDSPRARHWRDILGIDFHHVRIETDAHEIELVFSELHAIEVESGYAPFVARHDPLDPLATKDPSIQMLHQALRQKFGWDAITPYGESRFDAEGTGFTIRDIPATFSVIGGRRALPELEYEIQIESLSPGDYLYTAVVSLDELLQLIANIAGPRASWPTNLK